MKITRQVVALLIAGTGATVLSAGCGSDSPGKTVPHLTCQEPGTSECVDATSGVVCAEGETEGVEFVCEAGETCVDGACVGQCEGGTSECLGTLAVRICTDDGREWVPVACQPGTTCVDGACAPS